MCLNLYEYILCPRLSCCLLFSTSAIQPAWEIALANPGFAYEDGSVRETLSGRI